MFPTAHRPASNMSAAAKSMGVPALAIVLLLAALGTLLAPAQASGQGVQLPCRFYGVVEVGFAPVPDGTVITATISGDSFTATTPAAQYGGSTYSLKIVPPEGKFYNDGDLITFRIGVYEAAQTATWSAGNNVELNLSDAERESVSVTYVSDGSTMVALSKDLVNYGPFKNAVPTWVYLRFWPSISGATWISTSYKIEDAVRASRRIFEKEFVIPDNAVSISGTLDICADTVYVASLNGVEIGRTGELFTVETLPLTPVNGVNTLTVLVGNLATPSGTTETNPTGLIYKLSLNYEVPPSPPTPTPLPTPTASPSPSPTAAPTVAPTATPTPTPDEGGGSLSGGKIIGIAIFALIDLLLIALLVYLVWKFYISRERGL